MRVSIATALARVTGELRRIEARLSKVEIAVGDVVLDAQSSLSQRFHDLQDLDHARQEVAGLAEFLGNLAGDVPSEWQVDACAASLSIALEALAFALGRGQPIEAALGEFEAFEP
jgi:hypothetical protein